VNDFFFIFVVFFNILYSSLGLVSVASGLPEPVRLFEEVGLHGPEQHDGLARMPVRITLFQQLFVIKNTVVKTTCNQAFFNFLHIYSNMVMWVNNLNIE
jgi:hypothetical protein